MRERVDRFLGPEGSKDRLDEIQEMANEDNAHRELLNRAGVEKDSKFKSPEDYSTLLLESKESNFDSPTGLRNREFIKRNIDMILSREVRENKRPDYKGFSVLFIDVDRFKNINDTLGHKKGDEVLKTIAGIIDNKTVIRKSDIPCRWAGDEFVILLPDCDSSGAELVVERIKEELKKIEDNNSGEEKITLSIGFANSKEILDLEWDKILTRADQAMYYAKKELGGDNWADFDKLPEDFKNKKN